MAIDIFESFFQKQIKILNEAKVTKKVPVSSRNKEEQKIKMEMLSPEDNTYKTESILAFMLGDSLFNFYKRGYAGYLTLGRILRTWYMIQNGYSTPVTPIRYDADGKPVKRKLELNDLIEMTSKYDSKAFKDNSFRSMLANYVTDKGGPNLFNRVVQQMESEQNKSFRGSPDLKAIVKKYILTKAKDAFLKDTFDSARRANGKFSEDKGVIYVFEQYVERKVKEFENICKFLRFYVDLFKIAQLPPDYAKTFDIRDPLNKVNFDVLTEIAKTHLKSENLDNVLNGTKTAPEIKADPTKFHNKMLDWKKILKGERLLSSGDDPQILVGPMLNKMFTDWSIPERILRTCAAFVGDMNLSDEYGKNVSMLSSPSGNIAVSSRKSDAYVDSVVAKKPDATFSDILGQGLATRIKESLDKIIDIAYGPGVETHQLIGTYAKYKADTAKIVKAMMDRKMSGANPANKFYYGLERLISFVQNTDAMAFDMSTRYRTDRTNEYAEKADEQLETIEKLLAEEIPPSLYDAIESVFQMYSNQDSRSSGVSVTATKNKESGATMKYIPNTRNLANTIVEQRIRNSVAGVSVSTIKDKMKRLSSTLYVQHDFDPGEPFAGGELSKLNEMAKTLLKTMFETEQKMRAETRKVVSKQYYVRPEDMKKFLTDMESKGREPVVQYAQFGDYINDHMNSNVVVKYDPILNGKDMTEESVWANTKIVKTQYLASSNSPLAEKASKKELRSGLDTYEITTPHSMFNFALFDLGGFAISNQHRETEINSEHKKLIAEYSKDIPKDATFEQKKTFYQQALAKLIESYMKKIIETGMGMKPESAETGTSKAQFFEGTNVSNFAEQMSEILQIPAEFINRTRVQLLSTVRSDTPAMKIKGLSDRVLDIAAYINFAYMHYLMYGPMSGFIRSPKSTEPEFDEFKNDWTIRLMQLRTNAEGYIRNLTHRSTNEFFTGKAIQLEDFNRPINTAVLNVLKTLAPFQRSSGNIRYLAANMTPDSETERQSIQNLVASYIKDMTDPMRKIAEAEIVKQNKKFSYAEKLDDMLTIDILDTGKTINSIANYLFGGICQLYRELQITPEFENKPIEFYVDGFSKRAAETNADNKLTADQKSAFDGLILFYLEYVYLISMVLEIVSSVKGESEERLVNVLGSTKKRKVPTGKERTEDSTEDDRPSAPGEDIGGIIL